MNAPRQTLRWAGAALALSTCAGAAVSSCSKNKPPAEEPAASPERVPGSLVALPSTAVSEPEPEPEPDASAAWTIEAAQGGTLLVRYKGVEIATFRYVFWDAGYSWVDAVVRNQKTLSGVTTFDVDIEKLGLTIGGRASKSSPGELSIEYSIVARKKLDGIVGGGIEFNLNLEAGTPAKATEPALLPDRRGFKWDLLSADAISVSFDPPLPETRFERNQKNIVRCFLVGPSLEAGVHKVTMKARLPRGGVVRRSVEERYGQADRGKWYRQTLPWNRWPVDLSYLNEKPAGKRGHVKADGERLVFEDGTPIRFWGANVQAYGLFHGSKEEVKNQAKRLAALGYNLVRLHHHDSDWVAPNVIDPSGGTTQKLDDRALDMLDWWAKCLADEGIYTWLDIHVGRKFVAGDNIDGFAELAKQQGSGKGFNYVNPRIEKLMQEFAQKYIGRTNRYTGKPYTEDPAVMGVLLTNENDLTQHFGNVMAADKGNPVHLKLYDKLAREIASRAGLSVSAALEPWNPGPAKIVLNEIEHRYDQRAIERLRAAGLKALIATTSYWGNSNLYSLPALAAGDLIDVHSYGDAEALGRNPRYEANLVAWIGAAQVAGKPLSISEWNEEYPKRDRFVTPLYLASIAALQGWDAPMIYGYTQTGLEEPDKPDAWSTWNDPAITAMMPAAALLFRQEHVKEAKKTYRLDISRENLYYANTNPDTSAAIRTLVEQSKLVIGLPDIKELGWDSALSSKGGKAIAFSDVARDFIPQGQNFVVSDTGELKRDWSVGIETIDTPLTQAALGWIGKHKIETHDATFEIETPKAAVAVTSMDGLPIARSQKMLVTVVAQVDASPDDKLPFLAQPVEGTIAVRGERPLRLVPISPQANPSSLLSSQKLEPIAGERRGSEQVFKIGTGVPTHWFMLVP